MKIEHVTVNKWGQDRTYITKPVGLNVLWEQITGRKTITQVDLTHLHSLARLFGAGASSERIHEH